VTSLPKFRCVKNFKNFCHFDVVFIINHIISHREEVISLPKFRCEFVTSLWLNLIPNEFIAFFHFICAFFDVCEFKLVSSHIFLSQCVELRNMSIFFAMYHIKKLTLIPCGKHLGTCQLKFHLWELSILKP
jgi:hypothetical protein